MYQTDDLYLAAALQEVGQKLSSVWKNSGRATFGFTDSRDLEAAVAGYFTGTMQVPAHAYAERIRSAKSMAVNAVPRSASR